MTNEILAYQGDLLETLMRIVSEQLAREGCDFEYGETLYGAGNSVPCGRDAIGRNEDGQARCGKHFSS